MEQIGPAGFVTRSKKQRVGLEVGAEAAEAASVFVWSEFDSTGTGALETGAVVSDGLISVPGFALDSSGAGCVLEAVLLTESPVALPAAVAVSSPGGGPISGGACPPTRLIKSNRKYRDTVSADKIFHMVRHAILSGCNKKNQIPSVSQLTNVFNVP